MLAAGAHKSRQVSRNINTRTISYTIGAPGVSGCDHNFSSIANALEQSLQLGGTTVIPSNSPVVSITAKCIQTVNSSINTIVDMGLNFQTDEYISTVSLKTADDIISVSAQIVPSVSDSSVYFSVTPSSNWNLINTGIWKVWITFNDNSIL